MNIMRPRECNINGRQSITSSMWNIDGKKVAGILYQSKVILRQCRWCQVARKNFFTEHYWGYTQLNPDTTLEYFVNHIPWVTYGTRSHKIEVDFGKTYGKEFAFLNELRPESVFLAEGSEISLEKSKKIRRIT